MNDAPPSSWPAERRGSSKPDDRRVLWDLIRRLSLRRGHFVLSSGATSDYYLDLRLTTTHPDGAALAGQWLAQEARRLGVSRVGGPTLGADPIVGAVAAVTSSSETPVSGFMVRSQQKAHGAKRQIEGHLAQGDRVIVFDDVVTTAGSLVRAIEAVREAGAEVAGAWCLVDREGGGREALRTAGVELTAVFQVGEILADQYPGAPHASALGGASDDPSPKSAASGDPTPGPAGTFRPTTPHLAVDAILELVPGHVLLIERKNPPLGWALPGGFVDPGESLETAVRREIHEETGLSIERAEQLHTYSTPDRDPRFHTVSTIFVATAHGDVEAADDAKGARLFRLDALPPDLCFDHVQVLEDFQTGRYGLRPGQLH